MLSGSRPRALHTAIYLVVAASTLAVLVFAAACSKSTEVVMPTPEMCNSHWSLTHRGRTSKRR